MNVLLAFKFHDVYSSFDSIKTENVHCRKQRNLLNTFRHIKQKQLFPLLCNQISVEILIRKETTKKILI